MTNLIFQFIAAGILLLGLYLMGNKRKSGPFLCAFSEGLWIACFIPYQMWGGVFLSSILFFMQTRNFIKWNKEGLSW